MNGTTSIPSQHQHDWWDDDDDGIQQGLGHYHQSLQTRAELDIDRAFDEASQDIAGRDPMFLTVDDLMTVMNFKNSLGRRCLAQKEARKSESEIRPLTEEALRLASREGEADQAKGLKLLTKLRWVGTSTASAILAMALPTKFGVIDRLVMGELARLVAARLQRVEATTGSLLVLADAAALWAERNEERAWARYSHGLRVRSSELQSRRTPREIDKSIWGWAEHRIDQTRQTN